MPSITPVESIVPWLQDIAARDRAGGTLRRYRSAVLGFLTWYESEEQRALTYDYLTAMILVGYRNYLQHTLACAPSTINGHLSALRAWCAWLTRHNHLAIDPALYIKLVGQQRDLAPQGLKDIAVNALLREAQHSRHAARDYAILRILLQSGMRISECASLTMAEG